MLKIVYDKDIDESSRCLREGEIEANKDKNKLGEIEGEIRKEKKKKGEILGDFKNENW